jgi:hypothetical protein
MGNLLSAAGLLGARTTLVENPLSSAKDETVREVAVSSRPLALREADSQKRRVALCDQVYTAPHEAQTRGPRRR